MVSLEFISLDSLIYSLNAFNYFADPKNRDSNTYDGIAKSDWIEFIILITGEQDLGEAARILVGLIRFKQQGNILNEAQAAQLSPTTPPDLKNLVEELDEIKKAKDNTEQEKLRKDFAVRLHRLVAKAPGVSIVYVEPTSTFTVPQVPEEIIAADPQELENKISYDLITKTGLQKEKADSVARIFTTSIDRSVAKQFIVASEFANVNSPFVKGLFAGQESQVSDFYKEYLDQVNEAKKILARVIDPRIVDAVIPTNQIGDKDTISISLYPRSQDSVKIEKEKALESSQKPAGQRLVFAEQTIKSSTQEEVEYYQRPEKVIQNNYGVVERGLAVVGLTPMRVAVAWGKKEVAKTNPEEATAMGLLYEMGIDRTSLHILASQQGVTDIRLKKIEEALLRYQKYTPAVAVLLAGSTLSPNEVDVLFKSGNIFQNYTTIAPQRSFIGGLLSRIGSQIFAKPAAGFLRGIIFEKAKKETVGQVATSFIGRTLQTLGVVAGSVGGIVGRIGAWFVSKALIGIGSNAGRIGAILGGLAGLLITLGPAGAIFGAMIGAGIFGIKPSEVGKFILKISLLIASITFGAIAVPFTIILIGLPILTVLILFIINSGAYVVPPSPDISVATGGRATLDLPGGIAGKCPAGGDEITETLAASMKNGVVKLLPNSIGARNDRQRLCITPTMIIMHWSAGPNDDPTGNNRTYSTLVGRNLACQVGTDTASTWLMQPFYQTQVEMAWCANSWNSYSISNEMAGNSFTDTPPPPNLDELELAYDSTCKLMQQYKIPWCQIFGHLDVPDSGGKPDPGRKFEYNLFIPEIKRRCPNDPTNVCR